MIRPTFLGFETAKRALSVSQAGLDIVGHNISNAQTAGFTRQRVDQVSMSMNGMSSRYATHGAGAANYGSGTIFSGVSQMRDVYLDNRYRAEAATTGELGVKEDGLTDINNIFDEIMSDGGLYTKMGDLMNAIAVLGQSANTKEHAMVVRDTVNQLVQIMNKNAQQLEDARAQQMLDLQTTVDQDVNTLLAKIADLNKQIKEDHFYGNPSNELNDERNLLIDNLSEYLDITVVRTPTKVSADLTIETLSIELNNSGPPPVKLVDGSSFNPLEVSQNPENGNAIVSLLDGISGLPLIDDLAGTLQKGGIKGFLDIINGGGPKNTDGSTFRGIPYYMAALDEYAVNLAEIMNRVNNISQQESELSVSNYAPVLTGSAADDAGWAHSIEYGAEDFGGRNTNMSFEYSEGPPPTITATYTDADGNNRTATADYAPNATIDFLNDTPPYSGSATSWINGVISGDPSAVNPVNFEGNETNLQFTYDDVAGTMKTTIDGIDYEAAFPPGYSGSGIAFYPAGSGLTPPTPPSFRLDVNGTVPSVGDAGELTVGNNVAFSIKTNGTEPVTTSGEPPVTSNTTSMLIDAGWPAVPPTDENKNLIVPLIPSVTGSDGKQPAWINTIKGGVIQFSGKEYDITYEYDPTVVATPPDPAKNMKATMTDANGVSQTYYGTYDDTKGVQNIDFRDENGSVMFTVNTTANAPDSGTPIQTNVDAKITAKNIAVSQNWFDDPLYITTSKSNAPNQKEATLALDGSKNPTWLTSVSMGPDSVAVPNGSYQFKVDTTSTPNMISVEINGITYKGEYKSSSSIELKGGVPEKVGLVIMTNSKDIGKTDAENSATIRNDTGARNDNINKLLTEMKSASNYEVSGIKGGFQEFLVAFQAQMGLDKNLNSSLLDASLTVMNAFADRRDAISAVSIDEEGINMMTYQNYYNAAARYMTTLDEALDKIINGMGVVGR